MSDWAAKRFWEKASVAETEDGFTVHLDARPLRTPAKAALIVPSALLAQEIAAEWDAQEGKIDPSRMPFTRSANAAVDKVRVQHAEVADLIAEYGATDLLCYRADSPAALQQRQAERWDPVLEWADKALGARLNPAQGVMFVAQPQEALDSLKKRVQALDPFRLTAFHDLVSLSGSLVLGFATALDHLPAQEAWDLSQLDEVWQQEQWGVDDEAAALTATRHAAFLHAKRFYDLCAAQ